MRDTAIADQTYSRQALARNSQMTAMTVMTYTTHCSEHSFARTPALGGLHIIGRAQPGAGLVALQAISCLSTHTGNAQAKVIPFLGGFGCARTLIPEGLGAVI